MGCIREAAGKEVERGAKPVCGSVSRRPPDYEMDVRSPHVLTVGTWVAGKIVVYARKSRLSAGGNVPNDSAD